MNAVSVGVVGCGAISDAYFAADDVFDVFEIVACADLDRARAEEKADEHGVTPAAPEGLYADSGIELVVNLTPPSAHADVCLRALEAGKHVYTEKPFAIDVEEARTVLAAATERGLLVGSAPDTVLGAGVQTARAVLDEGRIGDPVGATAVWTSPGHERWHPDPDLYYRPGGGPLFDMGPYYVTALAFLLGPAARVTGSVRRAVDERVVGSGPRRGETIDVAVPTHETGVVDFERGATATVVTSFDVEASRLPSPAFELYGTEGTMALPDPNTFDGTVRVCERGGDWEAIPHTHDYTAGRGAGVADAAYAIRSDWAHRTGGDLGLHVLDVLAGVRRAAEEGRHVPLESTIERPPALPTTFPVDPDTLG